jgi:acyl-coenzyme A thioesterase PaaI-like protein
MNSPYFQDHMQGNICFGCGKDNAEGLQIKSQWQGEESVCVWHPVNKYNGWKGLLNGGIIGTLVDCHCMCTAMAAAYKAEGRELHSEPLYRYATGTLSVKYLLPTPMHLPIELRAVVEEIKGKKVTLRCDVYAGGEKTAEAHVVALRVYDSSRTDNPPAFAHH